jgi:branched-chain amino acid aminotransferase
MIYALGESFICNERLVPVKEANQLIIDQDETIYEVLRLIDSKPLFIEEHFDRFLGNFYFDLQTVNNYKTLLKKNLQKLVENNDLKSGNIRFQFNNNQIQNFCAWFLPFNYPTSRQYEKGVEVATYHGERNDPNIKSRDIELRTHLDNFIAKKKIYEAILINTHNEITEGSRSNIFFITDDKILTPPLAQVLPGITRQKIISLITGQGIPFQESRILKDDLSGVTSCFISGTSPKILPVRKIDIYQQDVTNPLLQRLIYAYDQMIISYLENFKWN